MAEEKKIYRGEPYESPLVEEKCHAVTLDNGVDLPYIEYGEENEEVVVTGAAYFHTWNTVLRGLAKKYHVYGIVMRQDRAKELNGEECYVDGYEGVRDDQDRIIWSRVWGMEVYEATQKLGLTKFHYVGKCHGVIPGWWIWRRHPEALISFASLSQSMHVCEPDDDDWNRQQQKDPNAFSLSTMRKKEGFVTKAKETAAVGVKIGVGVKADPNMVFGNRLGTRTEWLCDSYDDAREHLLNNEVPILYMFPSDDILFEDFKTANIWAMQHTARCRSVILSGERHLYEMDIPERLVWEVLNFMEWAKLPDA